MKVVKTACIISIKVQFLHSYQKDISCQSWNVNVEREEL